MYREQKDMSLGLGNTNGEEWWVCALHFSVQLGHFLISIKLFVFFIIWWLTIGEYTKINDRYMTDTGLIYYWYRTDIDWYRSPRVHKPWIETLPKNSIPDFWGRVWDAVIDGNGWEQKFPLTPASQLCGFISLQNGIQRRSQYHKFVVWCFIKCILKLPAWDDS